MKTHLIFAFLMIFSQIDAQVSAFVGTFKGQLNGDNLTMNLQNNGGNKLTGQLKDSYQTYAVNAAADGTKITGTAVEKTLGLTFVMNGQLSGSQLNLKMTITVLGQSQTSDVTMYKNGATASTAAPAKSNDVKTTAKFPSGATHDRNLVGTWKKSETYNSGYGDNFMGSSFEQSMIFFADGSMADGGSRASMSGSNYSGSSQGGAQATPNLYWYNIGNQLYLYSTENGANQSVHLGKYYIENGAMLITGTNGKKLLLTKR